MASVLKRLRETADMRELKLDDRHTYRRMKWTAQDDRRARRFFVVKDDGDDEKVKEARKRSKEALKELNKGSRLKSFVKAVNIFFSRKA